MSDEFDSMQDEGAPAQTGQPEAQQPQQQAQPESFDDMQDEGAPQAPATSIGQQILAGVEGAESGVVPFHLLQKGETALGLTTPEDIERREREYPWTHGIAEGSALAASTMASFGMGAAIRGIGLGGVGIAGKVIPAIAKASEAAELATAAQKAVAAGELGAAGAVEAAKLANSGVSLSAKVGSAMVAGAVEMGALSISDEGGKLITNEPKASATTALSHFGLDTVLGGLTGGVFAGAVSPLWQATFGTSTEEMLNGLTNQLGGASTEVPGSGLSNQVKDVLGVETGDALGGVIDNAPGARQQHAALTSSDTVAGKNLAKSTQSLNDAIEARTAQSIGRTPEDIANPTKIDKYNTGASIGDSIADDLELQRKEHAAKYEAFEQSQGSKAMLPDEDRLLLNQKIGQSTLENNWHLGNKPAIAMVGDTMQTLRSARSVDQLRAVVTNMRDVYGDTDATMGPSREVIGHIQEAIESSLRSHAYKSAMDKGGPEAAEAAVSEYNSMQQGYKQFMGNLEDLNTHLHLGSYNGPKQFIQNLREFSSSKGEDVLKRLSGTTRADQLNVIGQYPKAAEMMKNYHIDNLINDSVVKGESGAMKLSPAKLTKNLNDMSQQVKDFALAPGQQEALNVGAQALDALNHKTKIGIGNQVANAIGDKMGPWAFVAGMATGHTWGAIGSAVAKKVGVEAKDGLKYGLMKFVGSSGSISGAAFKHMVEYSGAVFKGLKTIDRNADMLVKGAGSNIVIQPEQREKLTRMLTRYAQNPDTFQQHVAASPLGHYMPDHQQAVTQTVATAMQYCQQFIPKPSQNGPLDTPSEPSFMQQARYERCANIAINPNIVFEHIRRGTLQPTDIQDIQSMYPEVYQNMQQKITSKLAQAQADGVQIPYSTKVSMSMFLGQPLDSSMTPSSIMAAQPQLQQPPPPPPGKKPSQKAGTEMKKDADSHRTPTQSAEADRSIRD